MLSKINAISVRSPSGQQRVRHIATPTNKLTNLPACVRRRRRTRWTRPAHLWRAAFHPEQPEDTRGKEREQNLTVGGVSCKIQTEKLSKALHLLA